MLAILLQSVLRFSWTVDCLRCWLLVARVANRSVLGGTSCLLVPDCGRTPFAGPLISSAFPTNPRPPKQ